MFAKVNPEKGTLDIDMLSFMGVPDVFDMERAIRWVEEDLDRRWKNRREAKPWREASRAFQGHFLWRLSTDMGIAYYLRHREHPDGDVLREIVGKTAWAWRKRKAALNRAHEEFLKEVGLGNP